MSKKQTIGNRQQSGQDKEIYGEVVRPTRKITLLTPGSLENKTTERDRLRLLPTENAISLKNFNANETLLFWWHSSLNAVVLYAFVLNEVGHFIH